MDTSGIRIDDQIREEIERIARDVIDWGQSEGQNRDQKPYWKPRFDREHLKIEGKRIVPVDMQVYYDLQLSRGATQNETPDLNWDFGDPALGISTYRARNEERLGHFMRHYPLERDAKLLELGMRSGHFLYFLLRSGYTNVTGIDCVKLNVLWCRKNGLDVLQGDAHELSNSFDPGSFDAIFAYSMLEHCYDPDRVLRECWTVLAPSGGLHIEIPIGKTDMQTAHCYSFSRRELGRMLKRIGFEVLDYHHHGPLFAGTERVVARKLS